MTPIAAGGIPPTGADFNGILNLITQSIRWANAGGGYKYNAAFATDTNVNGYPAGAVLLRGDGMGYWLNLADNNTTDPEGATPANWAPLESYGITAVTGLTNANVTLTPAQFGMSIITLAGTLTGNVQIIFPPLKSRWKIVNATTGAFTVTCKTASGTGVIVAQGGEANVYGDGSNIVLNALQVAPATASNQAAQFGQVNPGRLLNIQTFSANATYTPTTGTNKVRVRLVGGGGGGGGEGGAGASQVSLGTGGGAGAYAEAYLTSGFSGAAITVGAAGAAGSSGGGNGGNGGTTSFGALVSAVGGTGGTGLATPVSTFPVFAAGSPGGSTTSGANIVSAKGGDGSLAGGGSTTSISSGAGGASALGAGGSARVSGGSGSGPGLSASSAGAGGGGALALPGTGSAAGGAGGSGYVIVEEYA
jgi:hypothetical protein